jgi:hypothetical protein
MKSSHVMRTVLVSGLAAIVLSACVVVPRPGPRWRGDVAVGVAPAPSYIWFDGYWFNDGGYRRWHPGHWGPRR